MTQVLTAGIRWVAARQAAVSQAINPAIYDELANAEAALQAAVLRESPQAAPGEEPLSATEIEARAQAAEAQQVAGLQRFQEPFIRPIVRRIDELLSAKETK